METYRYAPRAPLRCPIAAFGGVEDAGVAREDLEEWRRHTAGAFRCRMLPGDHFLITRRPRECLRAVHDLLAEACARRDARSRKEMYP